MMIPPRPGEKIHHTDSNQIFVVLYFDATTQTVVTPGKKFPWDECSVIERLSDQEIKQRAKYFSGLGHPVYRHHPELK